MVWTGGIIGGRRCQLAPSLVALFRQADAGWWKRSTASDGSIGDPAHAARTSDHNPDANGDVLAGDLTDDEIHGPDIEALWNHLIATRDPRVKYAINKGRIVKGYVDSAGRPAWVPQPYTGSSPHTLHIHISVWDTPAAKNDTSPWFPTAVDHPPPPEPTPVPVPLEVDVARIIQHPNGSQALVGPGAAMTVLHTTTETEALLADGSATGEVIVLPNPLIWDTRQALAERAGVFSG